MPTAAVRTNYGHEQKETTQRHSAPAPARPRRRARVRPHPLRQLHRRNGRRLQIRLNRHSHGTFAPLGEQTHSFCGCRFSESAESERATEIPLGCVFRPSQTSPIKRKPPPIGIFQKTQAVEQAIFGIFILPRAAALCQECHSLFLRPRTVFYAMHRFLRTLDSLT